MIEETLAYSSYVIQETRQSRIDPDVTITIEVGMKCPRCKTELKAMDHRRTQKCHSCNLEMDRYGNALLCRAEQ